MTPPIVYGHDATWARLTAMLDGDRLPHALLFLGPDGIGKARVARRLAARLACAGSAMRPCGECSGCRQVLAGSHPDLLLIGAPERTAKDARRKEIGIDQARALKRFVQLRAVSAARKMAIVDDADRLSVAAQNALLKTLEEPPGLALLVLVTATPGALLTTVRSRCQRIALRPLADDEVHTALVATGVPADEVSRLLPVAQGSPGQALRWRAMWQDAERADVLGRLAALRDGRYASVLAMSTALGHTEQEIVARLDALLAACRAEAARATQAGDLVAVAPAVQRADVVGDALRTLRRRNPNRTLLTEALALRLART